MSIELAAPPLRFAGFWVRVAAYLIDAFLLSLVGGAFPYLFVGGATPSQHPGTTTTGPLTGVSLMVSLLYFVLFWSHGGGSRTLGMRVFRLRVVRDDGSRMGVGDAFVRWLGLWVSFALCFIGVLWVAGDVRKQCTTSWCTPSSFTTERPW